MQYKEPGVDLIMEIQKSGVTTDAAPLLACIVGESKLIRDIASHKDLLFVGDYSGSTLLYPETEQPYGIFNLGKPGMEVVEDSIKVLADGKFKLFENASAIALEADRMSIVDTVNMNDEDLQKAEIGDIIILTDSVSGDSYETYIIDIDHSASEVKFSLGVRLPVGSYSYVILKSLIEEDITASPHVTINVDDQTLEILADAEVNTSYGTMIFDSGQVYVAYEALRHDQDASVMLFNTLDEVEAEFEVMDDRNPLGKACQIAKRIAGTLPIAAISAADTPEGHGDAMELMASFREARSDIFLYYIVPLTSNEDYFQMYQTFVQNGEDQVTKRLSTLVRYTTVPDFVVKVSGDTGTIDLNEGSGQNEHFIDDNATFVADGVNPGMEIRAYQDAEETSEDVFIVDRVLNDNIIQVVTGSDSVIAYDHYRIVSVLDNNSDRAAYVKSVSEGIKTSRVVNVFPARHIFAGEEFSEIYGTVKIAAYKSSLPVHVGLTRLSMPEMTEVIYPGGKAWGSDYRNIAANGGTFILKNTGAGNVQCAHQLTTDNSDVKTQEWSVRSTFDYNSLYFVSVLDAYIGKWNVIESLFQAMGIDLASAAKRLQSQAINRYGAPLIDYEITKLAKNPDMLDGALVEIEMVIPTPLNNIRLTTRI